MSKCDSVYRVWDTIGMFWVCSGTRDVWSKAGIAKAAILGSVKVFDRQSRYVVREFAQVPEGQHYVPAMQPDALRMFDGEGGYDYTDDQDTAERWAKYLGTNYEHWLEPLAVIPQDVRNNE